MGAVAPMPIGLLSADRLDVDRVGGLDSTGWRSAGSSVGPLVRTVAEPNRRGHAARDSPPERESRLVDDDAHRRTAHGPILCQRPGSPTGYPSRGRRCGDEAGRAWTGWTRLWRRDGGGARPSPPVASPSTTSGRPTCMRIRATPAADSTHSNAAPPDCVITRSAEEPEVGQCQIAIYPGRRAVCRSRERTGQNRGEGTGLRYTLGHMITDARGSSGRQHTSIRFVASTRPLRIAAHGVLPRSRPTRVRPP